MVPAHKGLEAADGVVVDVHDGLVVHSKFVAPSCAGQFGAETVVRHHLALDRLLPPLGATPSLGLGEVHGGVGPADQLLGIGAVPTGRLVAGSQLVRGRDAHAAADLYVEAVKNDFFECLVNPRRES